MCKIAKDSGIIGAVATITHRQKLHPLLLPGRGCHFMHQVYQLPPSPPESERYEMFKSFLNTRGLKECFQNISPTKFAGMTEGFSPRDLKKTAKEIDMKFITDTLPLSCDDLEQIISETKPSTLWGVDLQRKGTPKVKCTRLWEIYLKGIKNKWVKFF